MTCRSLIYDGIGEASYASIRGSPWKVEAEVAIYKLCVAVDVAIDADPLLKEIFERPRERAEVRPLQLLLLRGSESMGNHDSNIVDAGSVD